MNREYQVGVVDQKALRYPAEPPYNPSEIYPESVIQTVAPESNQVYASMRRLFRDLQLDAANYGKPEWNPLGEIVKPGETVVIKPNLVRHYHDDTDEDMMDVLITHGSVIRTVIDYVYKALRGKGRIVVADACMNDAIFAEIYRHCGFAAIQELYRVQKGFEIEVYDLRKEYAVKENGVIVAYQPLAGDPLGYAAVDLKNDSEFYAVLNQQGRLRAAESDLGEARRHHNRERNEYFICKTFLAADVFINLPKLKTHRKAGVTLCLKNLIGINGDKKWLPHHRIGAPCNGGDQYDRFGPKQFLEAYLAECFKSIVPWVPYGRKLISRFSKDLGTKVFGITNYGNQGVIRSGNWYGNDTIWRTILDINKILYYADHEGKIQPQRQRKFFFLIDGIISGEGCGPLGPTPRKEGLLIAGFNPVVTDLAACYLMGFDFMKIPLYQNAFQIKKYPLLPAGFALDAAAVTYNSESVTLNALQAWAKNFDPHFGWRGHIELDQEMNRVNGGLG